MASSFLHADAVGSRTLEKSQMAEMIDHVINVGSAYTEVEHLYWDHIHKEIPRYKDNLRIAGEDQIMLQDCTESLQVLSGGT